MASRPIDRLHKLLTQLPAIHTFVLSAQAALYKQKKTEIAAAEFRGTRRQIHSLCIYLAAHAHSFAQISFSLSRCASLRCSRYKCGFLYNNTYYARAPDVPENSKLIRLPFFIVRVDKREHGAALKIHVGVNMKGNTPFAVKAIGCSYFCTEVKGRTREQIT